MISQMRSVSQIPLLLMASNWKREMAALVILEVWESQRRGTNTSRLISDEYQSPSHEHHKSVG